jgi:hypothetical protein
MSVAIPRLDLPDMPPELAAALQPRVDRLGYLGEFFRCAAHQPHALLSFMHLTDDLKQALPDHLTEVVALTVAGAMGNAYERNQHERLCRRLGFADDWTRDVNALEPAAGRVLRADERLVQQLTLAVIARNGQHVTAELEAVVGVVGPAPAVAILLLIGRYVTHALVVNALQLQPPVASIFEKPS